jgi:amino acid adenylation domain-containing protein/thioester reductase-like protein
MRPFLARFYDVAADAPEAPALVSSSETVSYGTLAAQAEALGAALRVRGAGPGHLVALALPRSPAYVTALLGTWAAGAAFLPLSSGLPEGRRALLLGDARPAWILGPDGITEGPGRGEGRLLDPDLAYVIYTSGTTGAPKGVMVPHHGVCNFLRAQIDAFDLRPGDRSLLCLSTGFDASISDIGAGLLAGAALCLEPDERLRGPAALTAALRAHAATHVDLPPSLLPLLRPEDMPPSLRTVIIGGEAAPPAEVRRWAARLRVVNVYGPTEATVCTSLCACDTSWRRPLIGRPIPGATLHILDEARRPVPAGTPGELYIGGVGLALGYLGRPDLTAARFLAADVPGGRLYRTGDLVVDHGGGEIEFLGRVDRQLKLRGQLVEPEEIEAQLRCHPDVAQAAVVPVRGARGRTRLVAYVSGKDGARVDADGLREHLAGILPGYMLPSRIVCLQALPRTDAGKVDLSALAALALAPPPAAPAPDIAPPAAAPDIAPPAAAAAALDDTEAALCALFAAALEIDVDVDGLAPTDDLTALGADSLTALEVAAAAAERGLALDPAALTLSLSRHRTVRALRAHLQADRVPCAALIADVAALAPAPPMMPAPAPLPRRPPAEVLLTGATGFLGAHLLDALLRTTTARVHCLVRTPGGGNGDEGRALSRLYKAWRALGLSPDLDVRRVRALPGDAAAPRLGLPPHTWDELAATLDAIYHCAAQVNLLLPYAALRRDNVVATARVLELAGSGAPKALHHASSLSVLLCADPPRRHLREEDPLLEDRDGALRGGYAQSKWAAEHLIARSGLPARRYRLGLLTGDSRRGVAARGDLLSLFLRKTAALGCLPDDADLGLRVYPTPIDFAAAALCHLSLSPPGPGAAEACAISATAPLSLDDIVRALRQAGCEIALVPRAVFQRRLGEGDVDPAYRALCAGLARTPAADRPARALDLFAATSVTLDLQATERRLDAAGLRCPPPDPALLRRYLRAHAPDEDPTEDEEETSP